MSKSTFRKIFGISIALGVISWSVATKEKVTTPEQTHPHGYMIANYTVKDRATFNKYMEAAGTLAPKYNGKVIIYNENPSVLEGTPASVIAVAEFPSLTEAEHFYNSAEYTAARQFRIASTEGWVILTEGAASAAYSAKQPQGYQFVNYTINDQATFDKYMETAGVLAPKYDGKVIIYNKKIKVLEGNPKSIVGVAEFKSIAEAERFYNSPEYTTARRLRIASTEGWVLHTASLPQSNQAKEMKNRRNDITKDL